MKLSELKEHIKTVDFLQFKLWDGSLVPKHFHVTEIGWIDKQFIDCGGTIRREEKINFQLWYSDDKDHRLAPEKLIHIIELSEKSLELKDTEIEVEYQTNTISKYNLIFEEDAFVLMPTQTDCLAKDNCGIDVQKPKVKLSELQSSCCEPGSGCC
jgi:hypothetical protein